MRYLLSNRETNIGEMIRRCSSKSWSSSRLARPGRVTSYIHRVGMSSIHIPVIRVNIHIRICSSHPKTTHCSCVVIVQEQLSWMPTLVEVMNSMNFPRWRHPLRIAVHVYRLYNRMFHRGSLPPARRPNLICIRRILLLGRKISVVFFVVPTQRKPVPHPITGLFDHNLAHVHQTISSSYRYWQDHTDACGVFDKAHACRHPRALCVCPDAPRHFTDTSVAIL
jgi:hypothetical protein